MRHKYLNFFSDVFEEHFHYDGDLGALYTPKATTFRVWSPAASEMQLLLYPSGHDGEATAHAMARDERGTWFLTLEGDHHGVYYNYLVTVNDVTHEAVDPYAKAVGVNGQRGMVVDLARTNPPGWDEPVKPEYVHFTEAVIYELHVRDASIHETSGIQHKGKYLGLTERGTRSPQGLTTGLDHLVELGVTHVHLLPVFDFLTVDEADTHTPQYNWGYDPLNYNVPEGSYATDPFDGAVRIREFKQMVQAFNQHGIRVVMDVVYNHTGLTEDSNLNKLFPGYYYREDIDGNFSNGSGCGNELASERSMVRKLIVDSVVYWAREYKIDGFRFDLMGLHDLETMNQIRQALDEVDPRIVLYGEGWTAGPSPLPDEQKALKGNAVHMPGIAVFNDDMRDGIRGDVFHASQPGFVNSGRDREESVKFGIVAATHHPQVHYDRVRYAKHPWAAQPNQSINYVEAHDNLTLWDKLQATSPHDDENQRMKMHKLSLAMVLTAQGIPFLHAGMDFLRTKQGDDNSYRSPDHINAIDWERKSIYNQVFQYCRGLIHLRRMHPAFRMITTEQIQQHLHFISMPNEKMIGFTLGEYANGDPWRLIVVLFNACLQPMQVALPEDNFVVVVNGEQAGTQCLRHIHEPHVMVPSRSAMVLVDEASFTSA